MTSLSDALSRIQADGKAERLAGLADLKKALRHGLSSPFAAKLKQKAINALFEDFSRVVLKEKSIYLKTVKTASSAGSRLEAFADAFRLLIDTFLVRLRAQSLGTIIGHISQALPNPDGVLCIPLRGQYLKSLVTILAHAPHVEHFNRDLWCTAADICIKGTSLLATEYGSQESNPEDSGASRSFADRSVTQSSMGRIGSQTRGTRPSSWKSRTEDLLRSIAYLTETTNCPILERGRIILDTVISHLETTKSSSGALDAFKSINNVLMRLAFDATSSVKKSTLALVPLVKSFWALKSGDLRDELLATLLLIRPFLKSTAAGEESSGFYYDLEGLLHALKDDYMFMTGRDRRHLRLDDLGLNVVLREPMERNPLQVGTLSLRRSSSDSEHNWILISIIASITVFLDQAASLRAEDESQMSDTHPRKRLKRSSAVSEHIRQASGATKIALVPFAQSVAFLTNGNELEPREFEQALDFLRSSVSHSDPLVSCWGLLALAGCATQRLAKKSAHSEYWLSVWHTAFRLLSSLHHSRAACHLLTVMIQEKVPGLDLILESLESMARPASTDVPAIVADASIAMWFQVYQTVHALSSSVLATSYVGNAVSWLLSKWSPKSFSTFSYAVQTSAVLSVFDLSTLILFATESTPLGEPPLLPKLLRLGQLCFEIQEKGDLLDYLLAGEQYPPLVVHQGAALNKTASTLSLRGANGKAFSKQIFGFLLEEIETVSQSWDEAVATRSLSITQEPLHVVMTLAVMSDILANSAAQQEAPQVQALQKANGKLVQQLCALLSSANSGESLRAVALDILWQALPDFKSLEGGGASASKTSLSTAAARAFANSLDVRQRAKDMGESEKSDQSMSDSGGVTSQDHSQSRQRPVLQNQFGPSVSVDAFSSTVHALLALFGSISTGNDVTNITATSAWVDHFIHLPTSQMASVRPFFGILEDAGCAIQPNHAASLLDRVADECLGDYNLELAEANIQLCLQLMKMTLPLWTDSSAPKVANVAFLVYEWMSEKLVGTNLLSPAAQVAASHILFRLIQMQPDYGVQEQLSSARQTLLNMLQQGEVPVKAEIAAQISALFGLFVLRTHADILDDILKSLPNDLEWIEGISLRLKALANLAVSWPTLRRTCVYRIVEAVGSLPEVAQHASLCLQQISQNLGLAQPIDLLIMFRSHIIYQWLEHGKGVELFPFTIFGFPTLSSFLEKTCDDISCQVFLESSNHNRESLAKALGLSVTMLLEVSFSQAAACAIAQDLAVSAGGKTISHDAENRLRDIMGQDSFYKRLWEQFPHVLGHMFARMDSEDSIRKAFDRRKGYESAARIFSTLQTTDSATDYMPPNLKPCFRAQLLIEQIERLCRRTKQDPSSIWTNSSVALIVRIIFDEVHPSLGSLQARRTMRKLRVLLALAGPSCLSSYTVESLLHGIRPYLSDKHCSSDAIVLFQYLLENGTAYLKTQTSFVTGLCLRVNLELRDLLDSESDSTTQESTHRATLSKAEDFRSWLFQWGEAYERSATVEGSFGRQFPTLMQLARQLHTIGGSESHTPEGRLLLTLLMDFRSSKAVLTPASANACLRLLVHNGFRAASSYQEDILGSDEQASKLAVSVWESAYGADPGSEFRCWAARALGRAFTYEGNVPPQVASESSLKKRKDQSAIQSDILSSHAAILRLLVRRLEFSEPWIVSITEHSLRRILSATAQDEEGPLVQQCVGTNVSESLLSNFPTAANPSRSNFPEFLDLARAFQAIDQYQPGEWARHVVLGLIHATSKNDILQELVPALCQSQQLCQQAFAFILHSALSTARHLSSDLFSVISKGFRHCFDVVTQTTVPHKRLLLDALLYLRTRVVPAEASKFDRNLWLDIDFGQAAAAARECKMLKTALLLTEVDLSLEAREARRASRSSFPKTVPFDFMLSIFREVDEPDLFHGVPQTPSIDSVIDRLTFEGGGTSEFLLRGARANGMRKAGHQHTGAMTDGMIGSLTSLNMSNLALQLSNSNDHGAETSSASESATQAAIKLQQWDIAVPQSSSTDAHCLYAALQSINSSFDMDSIKVSISSNVRNIYNRMLDSSCAGQALKSSFAHLAALNEINEMVSIRSSTGLNEYCSKMKNQQTWMASSPLRDALPLLMAREAFFGTLGSNTSLQRLLNVKDNHAKLSDVQINLHSSLIHREQGALQESLANVAYLSECIQSCNEAGLSISAAVRQETAHVLWAKDEFIPSIRILKDLEATERLEEQSIPMNRAALLAVLGHHVATARLERPDDVMRHYLNQAVRALRDSGQDRGHDAGQVYHEFATYCHKQLTNPDNIAEFKRSERFAQKRLEQIHELEDIIKSKGDDHAKHRAKSERNKAKKWYDLDRQETERLIRNREQFLRQALDGYLYALGASDEHDTDVLRFLALWLEHASNEAANQSVGRILKVPTIKFAPLMNQLASRLQDDDEPFQNYMRALVERICLEHPHHGMYHIYAGSRTKGGNDVTAISRNAAALKLVARLASSKQVGELWKQIARANDLYVGLAVARSESFKSGLRIPLRKFSASKSVEREIPQLNVPPVTMNIPLRKDGDYSNVPVLEAFKPEMSIAGGLSAPKVVTAIASNGVQCKQLYKAGADDLRQDAIMEQVFDQVSSLLQTQKETRQRSLNIRTYKVIPLDATSGAIEFVQNTQPLNDFLRAAHARYNPKDYKWDACRNKVDEVRTRSTQVRIDTYRHLTEHFRPVLRHFFFERFDDPDDWFARRLAYTRSTAAISILGHALGLGDRHCQNILLDTATGEVVHIDLGVAFEAGRILAVPEVVPFRLTRDIVDGFGVMGVEGVFRRCCEFTLDALRANRDAIMTLLNVLRYDPLYSWSMSPLRARRLQQEQDREDEGVPGTARTEGNGGAAGAGKAQARAEDEEGGEADRALGVVERKLASGLSVMATVNELIQQATDERNLAVLFCGWAAFA